VLIANTLVHASGLLVYFSMIERSEVLFFQSTAVWQFWWWGGIAWGTGTLGLFCRHQASSEWPTLNRMALKLVDLPMSRGWVFLPGLVMLLAFGLRAHALDFQTVDDDEYASIQAILAIAETGVPQYSEEVWYTRSPLYHYLVGFLVWCMGGNLWTLRLPSVLAAVGTAFIIYRLGRDVIGSAWTGLGAMLLFALHPFMIFSGHLARFYQQQQMFALLTVYCFCRGFVVSQSMPWRYATLGAFLAAVLSQEISVILGFPLLLGYVLFAVNRSWREEIRLVWLALLVLGLVALDLVVFQVRTLTRLEGVSPNSEATLAFNFGELLNLFSVFVSYSRLHLVLSALLLAGLPFALWSGGRGPVALGLFFFSSVLFSNLLITGQSLRYQYWVLGLWLLLGVDGLRHLVRVMSVGFSDARHRYRWVGSAMAAGLMLAVVMSFSPWRVPGSYETKILGDASGAFQFIRSHMRPGDKVGATEPHPHGMLLETGRSDYDLAFPLLYDFVYLKDGVLRDRNAGSEVIGTVADLNRIMAENDRIWFAVNREKFRSRGRNLRWEYPSARAELLLRRNCTLAFETYLWSVFLWDGAEGNLPSFQRDWTR
jgi:hypothetical protein